MHTVGLERRLKRGWFVAGGLGCALFLPLPFSRRPGQNGARGYALLGRLGRDIGSLGRSRLRLAAPWSAASCPA